MKNRSVNKTAKKSRSFSNSILGKILCGFIVGAGFLMVATPAFASEFPRVDATSDREEILAQYPAYLHFVTEVGKDVDRNNTAKMVKIYNALLRRNPNSAALFLKGLRFEMVQKVELMGRSPSEISTHTPEIRRWVARYMKEWMREADEHLFRAISAPRSELARME